jgi:hypothetical protein
MFKIKYAERTIVFLLIIALLSQCLPVSALVEKPSGYNAGTTANLDFNYVPAEKSELQIAQEEFDAILADMLNAAENSDNIATDNNISGLRESIDQIKDISFRQIAGDEKAAAKIMDTDIKSGFDGYRQLLTKGFDATSIKIGKLGKLCEDKNFEEIIALLNDLKEMLAPENHNPLGTDLPNGRIDIEPVFAEMDENSTASTATIQPFGIMSADSALPAEIPSTSDLDTDAETGISEEIKDLVKTLTTVEIYEYVCNNVDYEPYYGARKGAIGTFDQRSGNDFDTASLLIGMLRCKGIPARYKTGKVSLTIDQAMKLTGTSNAAAASRVLASLGVPTTALTSQGKISALQIQRVWVEAYIAYDNYRGIGDGGGQKYWIPLDASFKQYEIIQGLDLLPAMGVDQDSYEDYLYESISMANGGLLFDTDNPYGKSTDELYENLDKFIKGNVAENSTFVDIAGGKRITAHQEGLLSPVLPYKVVSASEEFTSIPDKYKEKVTFTLSGSIGNSFRYEATLSDLYNKRVSISYVPATDTDASIISSYGGIFKTPAYLVNMKPQLKADGVVLSQGAQITLGSRQNLVMTFTAIGLPADSVKNILTAGDIYNISFDYGKTSPNELTSAAEKLKLLQKTANERNIYSEEVLGEFLCAIGRSYNAKAGIYDALISGQLGVRDNKLSGELMTGYRNNVQYLFGAPVKVNEGGMFIDVARSIYSVTSETGDQSKELAFMLTGGMLNSSLEHEIFENIMGAPAVSTMKVLQIASERNIPIYTVTKANLNEVLPDLDLSQAVKNDIKSAVNSGKTVTVPQRNIEYFDWSGAGYIVLDPLTGAAGYMIGGGLSGGSISLKNILTRTLELIAYGIAIILIAELAQIVLTAFFPLAIVTAVFNVLGILSVCYSVIYNISLLVKYGETGDSHYIEEVIANVLSFTALYGMGKLASPAFEELTQVKMFVEQLRLAGVPARASLGFVSMYGYGKLKQAYEMVLFFKNYGFSENQLIQFSESFDASTIIIIDGIFARVGVKFTGNDLDAIGILFKGAGSISNSVAMANSIVSLANRWSILPSQYKSMVMNNLPAINA